MCFASLRWVHILPASTYWIAPWPKFIQAPHQDYGMEVTNVKSGNFFYGIKAIKALWLLSKSVYHIKFILYNTFDKRLWWNHLDQVPYHHLYSFFFYKSKRVVPFIFFITKMISSPSRCLLSHSLYLPSQDLLTQYCLSLVSIQQVLHKNSCRKWRRHLLPYFPPSIIFHPLQYSQQHFKAYFFQLHTSIYNHIIGDIHLDLKKIFG